MGRTSFVTLTTSRISFDLHKSLSEAREGLEMSIRSSCVPEEWRLTKAATPKIQRRLEITLHVER